MEQFVEPELALQDMTTPSTAQISEYTGFDRE